MAKISFYDQISKNRRNSILLVTITFILFISLVYVIAWVLAPELSLIFLIMGMGIMVVNIYTSYNYGDRIVLAATNAKPADERAHVYLINTVEGLAIAAGIPTPKIYVIESDEMNAFATGKDPAHASVAVTTGLLRNLNRAELEGVIGHELSHVRNYDIRFATLVAAFVGLIAILSYLFLRSYRMAAFTRREERGRGGGLGVIILLAGFILAIFAPIAVRLVQAAISRRRELLADASSVELTRYPEGLASALEKIMKINRGKMNVSEAVSHLFFVDPNKTSLDMLYDTHPPIEQRIKILRAM